MIPSFSRAPELKHIIDQIPEVETEAFNHIGYTIGGMMVIDKITRDEHQPLRLAACATSVRTRSLDRVKPAL